MTSPWRACAAMLLLSAATLARAADVHVMEAWSRATPPGTTVGVGYLVLHNAGSQPLRLTGASSPRAAAVEMHETRVDAKGLSTMRPVKDVTIAPGTAVRFEAGGKHLMLVGLESPLVAGERVPLTLTFAGEPPLSLELDVRPLGAVAPAPHDDHAHH